MAESAARTSRSARSAALSDMSGLALSCSTRPSRLCMRASPSRRARASASCASVSLAVNRASASANRPATIVVGRARGRQVGPLPSREREALSRSVEVIEDGGGGGFVRQLAQARRPARHLERRRGLGGFAAATASRRARSAAWACSSRSRSAAASRSASSCWTWSVAVCPVSAGEGEGAGSSKVSVDMGESICSESTVAAARIISAVACCGGFTGRRVRPSHAT